MKIYDIAQATQITVNMVHKGKNYTVETTVLTRYGDGVLVTPITCNGELIDICNSANFEYTEEYTGIKHMFHVDNISRVDFAGSDFHVISGKEIVLADNMRKAERYNVQLMGTCVVNQKKPLSVIIQDISMRGFSVIIGKVEGYKPGDRVKVEFLKSAADRKMTLYGTLVREFKIGGLTALGCEMKTVDPRVLGFIMEKKNAHKKQMQSAAVG
ncbi:PilZ domain-containing protein [Butyrivibrio proteoclasticus]|uniref:PilZ domain-containing protein n=1 Tax=Butyrivibrio proteoclasticus TaxID=43305 RepID=UPI00047C7C6C|nr:PilZ domain-containing protein [Butyrivibrio proteoclasticus]